MASGRRDRYRVRRVVILLLLCSTAFAADSPSVIPATDRARLTECTGETVTVEGRVDKASWGKVGKVLTVEFDGKRVFLATAASKSKTALDRGFDGDVAGAMQGHVVRLTGRVARYRGPDPRYEDAMTMTLATPDQIEVVAGPATRP